MRFAVYHNDSFATDKMSRFTFCGVFLFFALFSILNALPAEQECGENEVYSTCASGCPITCENRNSPPLICPAICRIGCTCKPGFVLNKDGKCVKTDAC